MGKNEAMRWFRRRGGVTIRTRFMVALVLVAGIALTISGMIVGILQNRHLWDTTKQQLERVQGELRALATKGVDPETGKPFTSAPNVLKTFMSRSVISHDSGEAGFIDGVHQFITPLDVIKPEDDPSSWQPSRTTWRGATTSSNSSRRPGRATGCSWRA